MIKKGIRCKKRVDFFPQKKILSWFKICPYEKLELEDLYLSTKEKKTKTKKSKNSHKLFLKKQEARKEKFYATFFPSQLSRALNVNPEKRLLKLNERYFTEVKIAQECAVETPFKKDLTFVNKVEEKGSSYFVGKKSIPNKIVTIRVKPNNVFCTMTNTASKRVVSGTCSKYNVKMSKKALKYNYKLVLKSFLKETKTLRNTTKVLICVSAPRRIRRELLNIVKKRLNPKKRYVKKTSGKIIRVAPDVLLFKFHANKCFNGCRARKKRRKKQRGLRIYK